jgi:hypothetical protein
LIEFGLLVPEKKISKKNFSAFFFILLLLSSLGEGQSPSFEFPPPNLAQWFCRRFLNDTTPFLYFCDYLPLEEGLALYLNKLEFSLPKDNFVPSLIEFGLLVLEKIFKKCQCIFTLLLLSPLGEGQSPSFEET